METAPLINQDEGMERGQQQQQNSLGGSCCKKFTGGYLEFVNKGNVVQLAVAFIMGSVFQAIVTSLVNDIILPPVGVLFGNNMNNLFFVIKGGQTGNMTYNTLAQAQADGAVTENVGKFFQTIINFLVVSFVMYLIISFYTKSVKKWEEAIANKLREEKAPEKQPPSNQRPCPFCKKQIDPTATRCAFCTSPVEPRASDMQ
jgi:large conductance mechanosensitive channel